MKVYASKFGDISSICSSLLGVWWTSLSCFMLSYFMCKLEPLDTAISVNFNSSLGSVVLAFATNYLKVNLHNLSIMDFMECMCYSDKYDQPAAIPSEFSLFWSEVRPHCIRKMCFCKSNAKYSNDYIEY